VDENPEELTFVQKARQFVRQTLDFVFRKVLLVDLVIFVGVILSFFLTGNLSPIALSERTLWAGIVVIFCGGIVTVATGFTGKSFGVPLIIRRPEEARKFLDRAPEIRAEVEKRYNVGARLWFIGLGCVAISAAVEILFS